MQQLTTKDSMREKQPGARPKSLGERQQETREERLQIKLKGNGQKNMQEGSKE